MWTCTKKILSAILFLAAVYHAKAQTGNVVINGTIAEKSNTELTIGKIVNGKSQKIASFITDPANRQFAFSFPYEPNASYSISIARKVMGHRRLEVDKTFRFSLSLNEGKHYELKISPSLLDTTGKKGFDIKEKSGATEFATISANVESRFSSMSIGLMKVVDGQLSGVAEFTATNSGKERNLFFAIPVKEQGVYYIGTLAWRFRIYLKPNDRLDLRIDGLTGKYELIQGSEENELLYKWYTFAQPITGYGYYRSVVQAKNLDAEAYTRDYQNLQSALSGFKSQNKSRNDRFNQLFALAIGLDNGFAPLNFFYTLSGKKEYPYSFAANHSTEVVNFYNKLIQPTNFSDARLLKFGETIRYMNLYAKLSLASIPPDERRQLSKGEQLKLMLEAIPNDTLKAFFFKDQMEEMQVNNLSEFNSTFKPFEKIAKPEVVRRKYQATYSQFSMDTAWIGKSSYDFSLPDSLGKMVSMKNFKGKVVLIDVWATWCGPCKGEMPYLKAIEEDYKDNNDIVFVAISIDRFKDKLKWQNYIQKENLGGIHLIDDMGKSFGKKYQIASVPRYMLIDKKGNWIEVRCPNPSSTEELKKYLNEALKG